MVAGNLAEISTILGVSLSMLVTIIIWSAVWKGIALWKSARKNSPVWFIVLLIINTLGILEILYIFIFSKFGKQEKKQKKEIKRKK